MNVKLMCAAAIAGLMVAGCAKQAEQEEVAAVSVNGVNLTKSSIDADVELMVKAQGDKIPAEQLEYAKQMMANQVVQSFIVENVLVSKAKAEGFSVTDADRKEREAEFLKAISRMPDAPKTVDEYFKKFPLGEARARQEFESGILIDKMIKSYQAKREVKDFSAEAKKIIDNIVSNNAQCASSEADALAKIKTLQAELAKVPADKVAEKFAELAKANSACPSSAKGGDLGAFTHGQMVKEFDEMAFKLPVGKVSDPVKTQFGYHLILVTKKIPAVEAKGDAPAEPEKVQASHILLKSQEKQAVPKIEEVLDFLKKQDERAFLQDFVQKLVKAANVKTSDEFKQFLPPSDEPAAEPVEKTEKK